MSFDIATKFLSNGFIRLTQSVCLNDPFELSLTDKTFDDLSYTFTDSDGKEYKTSESVGTNSVIKYFGVISLAETKDNLLMWSHYADSHRGVVIEFNIDDENPFDLFDLTHKSNFSQKKIFERVKYRKTRWVEEPKTKTNDDILKHYMLTKSDEWIYEKEYRYILPSDLSNNILIKNNVFYENYDCLEELVINSDDSNMKHIVIPIDDGYNYGEMSMWNLGREENNIFMLKVKPEYVSAIYLGANVDEYEAQEKLDSNLLAGSEFFTSLLNRNQPSKFYSATADRNRFELTFKKFDFYLSNEEDKNPF